MKRPFVETKAAVNPAARAAEKQASRDQDAEDLASGVKTREQLWAENTFLPVSRTSIDFSKIPIPTDSYPGDRAAEKQASRDQDAEDLASGAKSQEDLKRENSFLPLDAMGKIDYRRVPRLK